MAIANPKGGQLERWRKDGYKEGFGPGTVGQTVVVDANGVPQFGAASGGGARRVPLEFTDTSTESVDGHGSLNASGFFAHVHCTNGVDTPIAFEPIVVPYEATGTWTLNIMYSSSSAGGNVNFASLVETLVSAATAETILLNSAATSVAPGANTIAVYSVALTAPAASTMIETRVTRAAG